MYVKPPFDLEKREWTEKAACIGMDPVLFIPDFPDETDGRGIMPDPAAFSACATCYWTQASVNPCLSWAVLHGENGLWGGVVLTKGKSRMLSRGDVFRSLTYPARALVRHPPRDWDTRD